MSAEDRAILEEFLLREAPAIESVERVTISVTVHVSVSGAHFSADDREALTTLAMRTRERVPGLDLQFHMHHTGPTSTSRIEPTQTTISQAPRDREIFLRVKSSV